MRLIAALFAATLLGADAPPDSSPIVYEVKFLQMKGVDWRATLNPKLQMVSRQHSATVWTSTRDGGAEIARCSSKTLASPQVTANSMTRTTVLTSRTQKVVAEMDRMADGPVNHASYVAFAPRVEDETDACFIALTGRMLDQGVLAKVKIEDKQVVRVHTVTLSETLEGKDGRRVSPTVQIPECTRIEVSGEWLIPKDGVLVVSLGVHTTADDQGKAVVLERVAVIAAKALEKEPTGQVNNPFKPRNTQHSSVSYRGDDSGFGRAPFALNSVPAPPMLAPAPPSRSIPLPFDADGQPVPLPPLPDDLPSPMTSLPGSSEPCASPQKSPPDAPMPIRRSGLYDDHSARAGFEADIELCPADKTPASSGWTAVTGKPLLFRFALNDKLTIEFRASVSSSAKPIISTPASPSSK